MRSTIFLLSVMIWVGSESESTSQPAPARPEWNNHVVISGNYGRADSIESTLNCIAFCGSLAALPKCHSKKHAALKNIREIEIEYAPFRLGDIGQYTMAIEMPRRNDLTEHVTKTWRRVINWAKKATSSIVQHQHGGGRTATLPPPTVRWPINAFVLDSLGGARNTVLSVSQAALSHVATGANNLAQLLADKTPHPTDAARSALFHLARTEGRLGGAVRAGMRGIHPRPPGRVGLPVVMVMRGGSGGGQLLRYGEAIPELLGSAAPRVAVSADGAGNVYLRPADAGFGGALPLSSDVAAQRRAAGADPDAPGTVRVAAVAIPVNARGDVLVTQRKSGGGVYDGMWVFPGGHAERGEGLAAAAAREAREEAGVAVDAATLAPLAVWEGAVAARRRQFCVVFFAAAVVGGAAAGLEPLVLQAKEVSRAAWVPRALVPRLLDSDPSFPAAPGGGGASSGAAGGGAASGGGEEDVEIAGVRAGADGEAGVADVVRLSELRRGLGAGHKFALRAFLATRPEYFLA